MICDLKSFVLNTTYENTVFLSQWSIYGIVCLTGLFLLTPLTHLKRDWINSGTIKILFMTSEHSCREPEVGVKCCMNNSSKSVYCKVVTWCGHTGFEACARTVCLRLRLRLPFLFLSLSLSFLSPFLPSFFFPSLPFPTLSSSVPSLALPTNPFPQK